jgi:hypothetical protein
VEVDPIVEEGSSTNDHSCVCRGGVWGRRSHPSI